MKRNRNKGRKLWGKDGNKRQKQKREIKKD